MREMLQSPQQHYECLCSLLRRIRESQEASHELMRWGLVLGQDIHRVRASPRPGRAARHRAAPPGAAPLVSCSLQTQGRILPTERINLRHSSFFPSEDLNWSKEVSREASISTVSARPLCGTTCLCLGAGMGPLGAGTPLLPACLDTAPRSS